MKEKFKKIMVTTLCSMTAGAAIGCATNNTKIAQKINSGVNDFVASINKLDYVDTNSKSNMGKIVSAANENNIFNTLAKNTNIENTITTPSQRNDNFKLYVLSDTPYISLTSTDNNINLSMQFSTEKIETTSEDISNKINKLILKRAILMIYVNEIYNGNVNLTDENRKAINAYVNVIKENASFLNGNRGMVKNQLGIASNLLETESNSDIVNYYIIKSGEALEIRSNKIDSTISSIESIISILEQNLTPASCYYQNTLTTTYDNMLNRFSSQTEISNDNTNLAKSIAESINMVTPSKVTTNNTVTDSSTNANNTNSTRNNNLINNNYINQNTRNNLNNSITTLEEKTQNTDKVIENQPNIGQNAENLNNLTPSQRARLRRQERLNRQRNNNTNPNAQDNLNKTNNYISSEPKKDTGRTMRADRSNTQNQTNIGTLSNINNQNNITNTNSNNATPTHKHNKAIRVPYTETSVNPINWFILS